MSMKMNKNIQKNHKNLINQYKAWSNLILINNLMKINNKMKGYKKNIRRIKKQYKNRKSNKLKINK